MRALEEDKEQAEGRKPGELTDGETRVVKMVGGDRSRRRQVETQRPAKKEAHGGSEEGRGCGGEALNGDEVGGALGADSEQMEQGDTTGPGDLDRARPMTIQGGTRVPER